MKLHMEVGLGLHHIVLNGDPALLPQRGTALIPQIFGDVCCGQMAGWIKIPLGREVRLGPSHIMLDGDPAPPPQRGTAPVFGPCLLWQNGWMDQDATWQGDRPRPRPHCVRWRPSSPSPKGAHPQFLAHVCCGQTGGWIKVPLGREVGLGPGHIVLDGDPPPSSKGAQPPIFGTCLLRPNGRPSQLLLSTCQMCGHWVVSL